MIRRKISNSYSSCFGDWVDRLNYVFTPYFFIISALISTLIHFFGEPLTCWMPAHFTDNWVDYSERYCRSVDNFFKYGNETIASERTIIKVPNIYKWIPTLLFISGVLFFLPMWTLKSAIRFLGLNLDRLQSTFHNQLTGLSEDRFKQAARLGAQQLDQYLNSDRKNSSFPCPMRCRVFLLLSYLELKWVYAVLSSLVFFFWGWYLNLNFLTYGFQIIVSFSPMLQYLLHWYPEQPLLLDHVLCQMTVTEIGRQTSYKFQCSLNILQLYRKLFLFLWFWLILLAVLNVCSFFVWMIRSVGCSCFESSIRSMLEAADETRVNRLRRYVKNHQKLTSLAVNYLKCDGRLLLSLFFDNFNPLLMNQVVYELYNLHLPPSITIDAASAPEMGLYTLQRTNDVPQANNPGLTTGDEKAFLSISTRSSFASPHEESTVEMTNLPSTNRFNSFISD